MIIIHNKIIPFGNYSTINLFTLLFTKKNKLSDRTINHERIHSSQIFEMGLVGCCLMLLIWLLTDISPWWILLGIPSFYFWYCIEYCIVRFFHLQQNDAYHDISLEEEAYLNDTDLNYHKCRKPFAWLKYIGVCSIK